MYPRALQACQLAGQLKPKDALLADALRDLAARATLPVIGVPLAAADGLQGVDALLSTVQMPPGVPVATVGIGKAGAKNAAILAVQILAICDAELGLKLAEFKKSQEKKVMEKDSSLK